ncbi:uncharacterized protein LOC116291237 isoform X4 [Actinia tenebrosa]|uniref:Uncharacterized protein LOC116291237 isoform X4 n=1 Tax=Actinia tenebrosa TaxID=6105 RepID=A0A6P8HNI6_ACTTE|nr:uncharacterized protein LOC116291237 isoform X4 [Actinia tenebrosa]
MHRISLLHLIALLLAITVSSSLSATSHNQNGCYNTDVILACPHYTQNKPGTLIWRFKDKTTGAWSKVAIIRNGQTKLNSANTALDGRSAIHPNGSLEIHSLHPDDASKYMCIVKQDGRKLHVVKLSVACGKVTLLKREVCVEEDVILDCDAWHRTNPRKLHQVKWHKKNTSGNDVSWSLLVASSGSNVTVGDGFKLHGNGSLFLPAGRDESDVIYKCDVTKNDFVSRLDRHIIVVKNIKCHSEKQEAGTVKTTRGRIAMTMSSPIKGTSVTMETSTGSVTKPTPKPTVCGGVLKTPVGTFQSPNFPSAYPANSHCKWTISLPQDYAAMNFTLNHVNIEQEANCRTDFVAMYDELGNQVGCRLCGFHNNSVQIQVRGRVAVVVFKSDSSVQKTGFKLHYKGVKTLAQPEP